MKTIRFNQLGYRPGDVKKATLPEKAEAFRILRTGDNSAAYEGTAAPAIHDAPSGETVRVADFSALTEEGTFVLHAADAQSYPVYINANPYNGLRKALLDFFHYQKCGVDLACGLWSHPACHTSLATVYGTEMKKDVSGGWHDAGDYGRYVVPAAKAVADLLLAHEFAPNKDADLLDAVWFELEWMLKMQDEATGGVYHKVSCHHFDALDEMPHDELNELVLCPITSTATATFAASMAMAARFYPDKKGQLLAAAQKAWDWLTANPDAPMFKNPEGVFTGGYGDRSDKDERFWAACELFAATGNETFHEYIKEGEIHTGLGWNQVGTYGIIAYLYHAKDKDNAELTDLMKDALHTVCRQIMNPYKNDPYGVSLGDAYNWGSNMTVGNNAMTLLLARPFFPQKAADFTQAALDHLHYLLGRNPVSYSYITGFGANPALYPHHRPSVAKGQAVPGMVVGGPNKFTQQDPALKEHCTGFPPSKCYVDHKDSYSGNEITIYWNSPVYFMAAVLDI
ncbi:MAG: glycoside hydrolase family 9 protein [Defluviitaleaceae bacterium]|nr:glycoside hydrolase family 9 protein [Defluviitaleaceae bacterium]